MGTMKKALLSITVFAVIAGAAGTTIVLLATSHFSFREMDWNDDGETSVGEVIEAIDVDVRDVEKNGLGCREYYSLKDGREVVLRCSMKEAG